MTGSAAIRDGLAALALAAALGGCSLPWAAGTGAPTGGGPGAAGQDAPADPHVAAAGPVTIALPDGWQAVSGDIGATAITCAGAGGSASMTWFPGMAAADRADMLRVMAGDGLSVSPADRDGRALLSVVDAADPSRVSLLADVDGGCVQLVFDGMGEADMELILSCVDWGQAAG